MMKEKRFEIDPLVHEQKVYSASKINAHVLYKRLKHFNHDVLRNLQKKYLVLGLPNLEFEIPY